MSYLTTNLKDGERIDDLQYNGLKLIQDENQFCFGCDAVELANFVGGPKGAKVCDLGAGNGIVGVLLAAKKNMRVTAVEIQSAAAELCERNIALNGLSDRMEVVNAPMQSLLQTVPKGSYDAVVCNPPYSERGSGEESFARAKAVARFELEVTLKEVVCTGAHLLKFGGAFYMVNAIGRLAETIALMCEYKIEPKVLQILTPNDKKPPHLFLLKAVSGGKKGLRVLNERIIDTIL